MEFSKLISLTNYNNQKIQIATISSIVFPLIFAKR